MAGGISSNVNDAARASAAAGAAEAVSATARGAKNLASSDPPLTALREDIYRLKVQSPGVESDAMRLPEDARDSCELRTRDTFMRGPGIVVARTRRLRLTRGE